MGYKPVKNEILLLSESFQPQGIIATNSNRAVPPLLANRSRYAANPIAEPGAVGQELQVREPGSVIYHNGTYYFFLSGVDSSSLRHIILYTATDPVASWTRVGVILSSAEDPYLILNRDGSPWQDSGGYFWLLYERYDTTTFGNRIGAARSLTLGSGWTEISDDILARGGGGSIDEIFVASPLCFYDPVDDQLVLLYEANDGTNSIIAVALSTTLDVETWVKGGQVRGFGTAAWDALGAVPDGFKYQEGTFSVLFHAEETGSDINVQIMQTTDSPSDWDGSSFSDIDTTPYDINNPSNLVHDPNFKGLRRIIWDDSALQIDRKMWITDDYGESGIWRIQRFTEDYHDKDYFNAPIELSASNVLSLSPLLAPIASNCIAMWSIPLIGKYDFELEIRMSLSDITANRRYFLMGFGSGSIAILNGTDYYRVAPQNGYFLNIFQHTSNTSHLHIVTSGANSQLVQGTISEANVTSVANWILRYKDDGAGSYDLTLFRDSTQVMTVKDATHAALDKYIFLSQGCTDVATVFGGSTANLHHIKVRKV